MSEKQQNDEDADIMGTEVFDEDTKTQEVIEQLRLEEKKREEERRKKYENVTLKDVEEAIDLLTYFVEQAEKASELLNRIKGQQRQLTPEEQFQLQLLKRLGQI